MKTVQLITIAICLLNVIVLYAPGHFFGQCEKLTRDQLIVTYPKLEWIRWLYPLIQGLVMVWVLVTVLTVLVIFGESIGAAAFYSLGLFLCAGSIFDGSVAIFTPVKPIAKRGGYLFVYEEKSHFINWLQIIVSLIMITFVAVMVFV